MNEFQVQIINKNEAFKWQQQNGMKQSHLITMNRV